MVKESQRKKKTLNLNTNAKHIAFSKGRSAIFKKASELCTLCAVEMVIIMFSPGGKPYSFGNPSPNAVINRFENSAYLNAPTATFGEERSQRGTVNIMIDDLYEQYHKLNAQLKEEKKRAKDLKQMMKNFPDINNMNREQLVKFKVLLEDLKMKVLNRKEDVLVKKSVDLTLTLGGIYS